MADPTIDLLLSAGDDDGVSDVADQAVRAESYGVSHVSLGETTGWNIVPILSVVAERTDEVGVTDDVISPYSRAPTVLGQTALTLQDLSDGRFRLGLGTSSPAIAERWHGLDFDRPLRRLRETIDVVREVSEGGRVTYDGEVFDLGGLRFEAPLPDVLPPIDVAAFGPKTVELTGRFADGWIPQLLTKDGLADRMDDLRRGAELGGRDADGLRVSPIVRCCAMEDGEAARELARKQVSFLVGAYGPYYGNSVARQGYEDEVERIRAAWEERDTDAMAAEMHDEMLDSLAAAGTPEQVREGVEAFAAVDGVDAVRVGFVNGMDDEAQERTIAAVTD